MALVGSTRGTGNSSAAGVGFAGPDPMACRSRDVAAGGLRPRVPVVRKGSGVPRLQATVQSADRVHEWEAGDGVADEPAAGGLGDHDADVGPDLLLPVDQRAVDGVIAAKSRAVVAVRGGQLA